MAKILIKVHVAFPDEFLKKFQSQGESRRNGGELAYSCAADDDKPNLVYVIADWESVSSARRFWDSSEAQAQKKDWHAVTAPEVSVLRESAED